MAEPNTQRQLTRERTEPDAPAEAGPEDIELTDEQLDKVSGGVSNVLKTRHDSAKNSIANVR